jgi:hypothetical protein
LKSFVQVGIYYRVSDNAVRKWYFGYGKGVLQTTTITTLIYVNRCGMKIPFPLWECRFDSCQSHDKD